MQMVKKRSFNFIMVLTLLVSVMIPQAAFAFEIKGDEDNPKLTIHKYEQEPGAEQGEGAGNPGESATGAPLEGVEFTLTQTHAYNSVTDEWTEVSGAPFTRVTDGNGQIVIDNIELGRYKVQETDGPPHVNLNTEEYFVDVPMTNEAGTELNYDVHIYPKNEIIRGAVELLKLDGEQEGEVGLEGVVFNLYKANGELVQADLTTDSDGYIRVSNLEYGDYYFEEISAPEDYVLFGDKKEFSISKSGTITIDGTKTGTVETVEITNYKTPYIEKTINGSTETHETNRETEFTYDLKIVLPKDIQDYKKFIVTDTLDDRLSYTDTWTVDGIDASILDFEQNGQTLTWTVNNFAALEGLESFTIHFTAEIKAGVEVELIPNTGGIDFTNGSDTDGEKETPPVYVTPTEGSLKIIKQDPESGETLAGAEFELRDLDGKVIKSDTTDSNGEISWSGLDYGDYQLVETKAPEGYRILKNPIDVTIDKENSDITLTIDNYKTGWELPTTGGIGTILFTIIGLSVMGLAVYLYVRRKKQIA
ncbi:SpaH/EbpB family LPXTG-anchored major pilin [Pseudogracilibacillus sp. SE30717A]|uniref:SpaH/EbpB family LPXTG-anchored major pilin n=1 Tax=Pseudogracilibacillus sp. SE30717A TaxID=3098293 RepID=UPI00300E205C